MTNWPKGNPLCEANKQLKAYEDDEEWDDEDDDDWDDDWV